LPLLEPRPEVAALAKLLLDGRVFPEKAAQDAVHIAYAAWYRLDAIVSWNFRHIASAWARQRIEHALRELGYPELVKRNTRGNTPGGGAKLRQQGWKNKLAVSGKAKK